jgi:cytochrome bd ubiquinol oxidase subunit I
VHWICGVLVAVNGTLSGIFVVTANAWMNAPAGFRMVNGQATDIDPIAAMLNRASFHEVLHMILAAFVATGFSVAAVHAFFLLRQRASAFHRSALGIALAVGCVSTPLQILSGDLSARTVAKIQPIKLAAMEAYYHTKAGAPLLVGGLPNDDTRTTSYALRIPRGLSLLMAHDPSARVPGLEEFPRENWPNVRLVHWSFDLMMVCGFTLLAVSLAAGGLWAKHRRVPDTKWFLRSLIVTGPLGFVAIEAGWMVTELGRQPWIIYEVMRTDEAVTPMPGIAVPFFVFTAVYIFLAATLVYLLRRQFIRAPESTDEASAISTHV